MKAKSRGVLLLILTWCITGIVLLGARGKLTYLEYSYLNEGNESFHSISNSDEIIEQEFTAPYNILHGVSLMIDTYDRNNNSNWLIELIDSSTGKVVYSGNYRASWRTANTFNLYEFDRNIAVRKGNTYTLRIGSTDATDMTGLAFYLGKNDNMAPAMINGQAAEGSLALAVYGGDRNLWWYGYAILIAVLVSIAIFRWMLSAGRGTKIRDDKLLGGMLVGFMVLLLLDSFAAGTTFMDEWDNLRGGMIIADGGVLYRDYIAQHTPVMYYLCGIFAFFGAGSLSQFRLSYYFFEAVIWGLLYMRHSGMFGRKRMIALAALECIVTPVLFATNEGRMILSDNMQGFCMVILLLEFLRYCRLKKIGWGNSIIISLSVWGAVGSAFVSVYAVSAVVLVVLGMEIYEIIVKKPQVLAVVRRCAVLLVSMLVPPAAAAVYFKLNHALKDAFEQFYLFNRQIYAGYAGFGDNLVEPYISSVMNFPAALSNRLVLMITAKAGREDVLQFAVLAFAAAALVVMCMKKKYAESLCLFLTMIFSASRGYGFHGMGAWYTAVMIIAFFGAGIAKAFARKVSVPVAIVAAVILLNCYTRRSE